MLWLFPTLLAVNLLLSTAALKARKVHLFYPIHLIQPTASKDQLPEYVTNLSINHLSCFQNSDYLIPTILQTTICMLPYLGLPICSSIWGSRSAVVHIHGDVEFLKVNHLPPQTAYYQQQISPDVIPINATRWLEFHDTYHYREIIQLPAEPMIICARSIDEAGADASFRWEYRAAYLRERDRRRSLEKMAFHTLLLATTASVWLLPYLISFTVSVFAYLHGLKVLLILLGTSSLLVGLTPFMLRHKNRQLAGMYLHYFFNRKQAAEAKQLLRQKKPLFQALFFSGLLSCSGCAAVYSLYYYGGIDRELRNNLMRCIISLAGGWCTFFVCRSFERFLSNWVWVAMAVGLGRMLEEHINPIARDKIAVVLVVFSFLAVMGMRRLWRTSGVQAVLKSILRSVSSSVKMLNFPYISRTNSNGSTMNRIRSGSISQQQQLFKSTLTSNMNNNSNGHTTVVSTPTAVAAATSTN